MTALRAGLCCLYAFSVIALGAVEVWSLSIVEISAALLLVLWAFLVWRRPDEKVHVNPLCWPLLGLIGIGLIQWLFRATAYPFLTRTELLKLAAYFILFFLTAQAFRARAELVGLAWFLVLLCFAVSLFAIIQHFTSNGKIYWFRELVLGNDVFGPFVNRNHFAGFIELTLPTGLALLAFRGVRRDLFPMAGLLTIVPVSALILSASRGGIISFVFAMGVLAVLMWKTKKRAAEAPRLAALAWVALAALGLIAWVGFRGTMERFLPEHANETSIETRIAMFHGAARVFLHYPLMGSGLGTLISVYPRYATMYDGTVIDHAHDDYIEGLADTGLLGGLCGVAFLWTLYREARKNFAAEQSHFSRAIHAGAIAAVAALLVHSFADFNLHIPSNAMLFLLQAYLVTSPPLAPQPMASRRPGWGEAHPAVVR